MAAERLLTAQRKCFVSQRALAEILSIVKDDDEENLATSRQAIKRKRERELQIDTPYGPVWRSMSGFVMEKGKPLTVSYLDPAALLWAVCRDGQGFAEFLVRRHELHPSGPSQPWSICLYMDEVSPGNQLKPSNDRKLQVIYMSLKQLGGLALSKEDSWLLVSCIRSVDVKRCANGMAQVMKRFLEVFLVERRDVLRSGLLLPTANVTLCCKLGVLANTQLYIYFQLKCMMMPYNDVLCVCVCMVIYVGVSLCVCMYIPTKPKALSSRMSWP